MNNRVQTFSTAPLPLPMSIDVTVQVALHLSAWELIRWFPWRSENVNPYQIFVAECLLTRTAANSVARLIEGIWRAFPTAKELAAARPDSVRDFIKPLGLNQRALMMIESAEEITKAGEIKNDRRWLTGLPGVGGYVADAVRVMAFNEAVVPVDAVIGRVLRRVIGYEAYGPAYADRALWNAVQPLAKFSNPRALFMAALDLGASLCKPQNPICSDCPVERYCRYAGRLRSVGQ